MSVEQHNPGNQDPMNQTSAARQAVLDWLRANGVNTADLPADPRASVTDGQLTLQQWVRRPDGGVMIDPNKPNMLMTRTITVPVVAAPPPIVEEWLAPKCPTCGR